MIHKKEAIIFDLDGTLVDSMWIWKEIDKEYLSRFSLTPPADLKECIDGRGFTETAEYFKKTFGLTDTIEQIKKDWNEMAWDKYQYEVPLKKGVRKLLEYCKNTGIKLGIASSNSVELVNMLVERHGLQDYFSAVNADKDAKHGKPAPDIYLLTASNLQVLPENCLVFEDIPAGIMAGKAAGMTVCAVQDDYSFTQTDEIKRLADYYITDYEEVLELING